jgi:hypothetical protein
MRLASTQALKSAITTTRMRTHPPAVDIARARDGARVRSRRRCAVNLNELKPILLWCVGINYSVLLVWFGVFTFAHDWIYRLHGRWFKVRVETFDAVHYAGMAAYKIGILLFFLVPWLALCAVSSAARGS